MKWEKKGIIFNPLNRLAWSKHTALQPTPLVFEDKIRVYFGSRDASGVSRIGYFDCLKSNPAEIISWSEKPVLDIGEDGRFDDNGVVPSAVFRNGDEIWMYYAGYQLSKKVRFLVLGGLAISKDNGETFERLSLVPVLERTNEESLFRVVHSAMKTDNIFRVWYGGGSHFMKGEIKSYPVYDIRTMESIDGIHFPERGEVVISNADDEYRVGRPFVTQLNGRYYMFYGASTVTSPYRLRYAVSDDLRLWRTHNTDFGLTYNDRDFDSEMSAYPAVINVDGNTWLFYNGNDYGYYGVGLAKLLEF
jgi:hypothetical protein